MVVPSCEKEKIEKTKSKIVNCLFINLFKVIDLIAFMI